MRAENIFRFRESTTALDMSDLVATSAVSAQSVAIPSPITEIRVCCTKDAWISIGPNPTAAIADGSHFIGAGNAEYFRVTPGQKVAVIRDAADGNMSVSFMTR